MDNTKSFKIAAQVLRLEEERKLRKDALRSVIDRTNRTLKNELSGNNGQNSSNLVPA